MRKFAICLIVFLSIGLTTNAQNPEKLMAEMSRLDNVDNINIGGFWMSLAKPFIKVNAGNEDLSLRSIFRS